MCGTHKRLSCLLPVLLLLCVGVLRAEKQERWYLTSETEVRSIEEYLLNSELEKRSWLLQANELRRISENLNWQLAGAREAQRKLEQSFNESEAEWLMKLSLKNGEIAELALEAEKHKGAKRLLVAIIALAGWIIIIAGRRLF